MNFIFYYIVFFQYYWTASPNIRLIIQTLTKQISNLQNSTNNIVIQKSNDDFSALSLNNKKYFSYFRIYNIFQQIITPNAFQLSSNDLKYMDLEDKQRINSSIQKTELPISDLEKYFINKISIYEKLIQSILCNYNFGIVNYYNNWNKIKKYHNTQKVYSNSPQILLLMNYYNGIAYVNIFNPLKKNTIKKNIEIFIGIHLKEYISKIFIYNHQDTFNNTDSNDIIRTTVTKVTHKENIWKNYDFDFITGLCCTIYECDYDIETYSKSIKDHKFSIGAILKNIFNIFFMQPISTSSKKQWSKTLSSDIFIGCFFNKQLYKILLGISIKYYVKSNNIIISFNLLFISNNISKIATKSSKIKQYKNFINERILDKEQKQYSNINEFNVKTINIEF